jgi:DNA-binding LytR/AlgR family response regulator
MKTYPQNSNDSLLVINQKTAKKVLINNVVLLKGDTNYTVFHFEYGRAKTVAHSIKYYQEFLEKHGFLRVHRSFMINPKFVIDYDKIEDSLTMVNGHKASIARRRKRAFKGLQNLQ